MSKPFAFKPISAEHALRVPFYDVDPMHIVWHGNYVKYFEDGRRSDAHCLARQLRQIF